MGKLVSELLDNPTKKLTLAILFIRDSLLITDKETNEMILTHHKFSIIIGLLQKIVGVGSENEYPVIIKQSELNRELIRVLLLMAFEAVLKDFDLSQESKQIIGQIKLIRLPFHLIREDEQVEIPISQGGISLSKHKNFRQIRKDLSKQIQSLVQKAQEEPNSPLFLKQLDKILDYLNQN